MPSGSPALFLGIDFGTSGCRAVAIDDAGTIHGAAERPLPPPSGGEGRAEQAAEAWWSALLAVLSDLAGQIPAGSVGALAVDGTSGTLLLTDRSGRPLGPALMYNDARSLDEARRIADLAPSDRAAFGPTSALAKLLRLQRERAAQPIHHALNQADWLAGRLSGRYGVSDENNAFKLGYDALERRWPAWLEAIGVRRELLPEVVPPGAVIGRLSHPAVLALGYPPALAVVAGTTDSIAAFIATGAGQAGDAVTSLGSTLVIKLLSDHPVFSAGHGVYSHRLGGAWLAGGASNSGGAVLLRHFTPARLEAMTPRLDPDHPTGLDYYPLPCPGERFPYNDPGMRPRLTPRPADDVVFFQGLLEGMAAIEALGYRRLEELGAPRLRRVFTVGGGARNQAWARIREQRLGVPVLRPAHDQACYGAALLARRGAAAA
jgi:sugar (pentulose or hexulose) kinase